MSEDRYIEELPDDVSMESDMVLDDEERRFVALARMAEQRRRAAVPNADRAYEQFMVVHGKAPVRRTRLWNMWMAAIAGAAAMFVGMLVYQHFFSVEKERDGIVALQFDSEPQTIRLTDNKQKIDLSGKDSISYYHRNVSGGETVVRSSSDARAYIQRLSTPRGMGFKVILPDGSVVWLNAESTIEFPSAFTDTERRVVLKGEAYFKVARNQQAPFVVDADKMMVRVLGTEFDLKNYDAETPTVSLVKGSVEVLDNKTMKPKVRLTPDQAAWYTSDGVLHTGNVDTYAVTQWVSGFFYFTDEPLVSVLRELGRWYNLGVIFKNPSHLQTKVHFSASRNDNAADAVENLNRLRKVRVKIEGNDMIVY